jgi:hypothetical protein
MGVDDSAELAVPSSTELGYRGLKSAFLIEEITESEELELVTASFCDIVCDAEQPTKKIISMRATPDCT